MHDAADILRAGGVVIFPTETLYGIAACVTHPEALARIIAIKGRTPDHPMPLIAADVAQVRSVAVLDGDNARLAESLWPGPLTLVLPALPTTPRALVARDGTVGIRVTSHPMARDLAMGCGAPIVSTSANFTGHPAVACMADLDPALIAAVDAVLDGGTLTGGLPSTVIQIVNGVLYMIREGAIAREVIESRLAYD